MRLDANSESNFSFLYVIFRRRLATLIHSAHTHTHTHRISPTCSHIWRSYTLSADFVSLILFLLYQHRCYPVYLLKHKHCVYLSSSSSCVVVWFAFFFSSCLHCFSHIIVYLLSLSLGKTCAFTYRSYL